jgi:hypothetical protein
MFRIIMDQMREIIIMPPAKILKNNGSQLLGLYWIILVTIGVRMILAMRKVTMKMIDMTNEFFWSPYKAKFFLRMLNGLVNSPNASAIDRWYPIRSLSN